MTWKHQWVKDWIRGAPAPTGHRWRIFLFAMRIRLLWRIARRLTTRDVYFFEVVGRMDQKNYNLVLWNGQPQIMPDPSLAATISSGPVVLP